jgi:hypothetical protein
MSHKTGHAAGEVRSPALTGTREAIQTRSAIAAGEYWPANYAAV